LLEKYAINAPRLLWTATLSLRGMTFLKQFVDTKAISNLSQTHNFWCLNAVALAGLSAEERK
jgi:hypothetical protein